MPNPVKFIILNGPPGSGKSTVYARQLTNFLRNLHHKVVVQDSFAAPMKQFIAAALGEKYSDLAKDYPLAVLSGYSVREFLIDLSERYMKERYHDDIYGRLLYHRALRYSPVPDYIVVDDGGFVPEKDALGTHAFIVRIMRPGHDFSKDARGYLPNPNWTIDNCGSLEYAETQSRHLAEFLVKMSVQTDHL